MSRIEITAPSSAVLSDGILQTDSPLSGTLQTVKDQNNNSSTLLLATDETQVNSVLRINTDNSELLDIQTVGGSNRFNINRDVQKINLDFASNPASGTDLVGAIRTYQDGVNLSDSMSFTQDGFIGIGTQSPVGLLHLKRTAATTRMVIDGDAGQSKIITYRTNGLQRFGLYTNNTAESGANVGSDFQIRAYSDAGTLLNTPFFIKRSTGNIGINQIVPTAKLQINGAGATSATTSFLVQNSGGSQSLRVRDDLVVNLSNTLESRPMTPGGIAVSIQGGPWNGTVGLLVNNTANPIVAESNLGASSSNPNGASIYAKGGASVGLKSIGLLSNRAIISAGSAHLMDDSAMLEVSSVVQGFLPPRMTSVEKNAIVAPASGLIVYDTTLNKLCVRGVATWETITSI